MSRPASRGDVRRGQPPTHTGFDRITWAIRLLDPSPTDQVLEVGPSRASVLRLLQLLPEGRLTVLDRSPTVAARMRAMAAAHAPEDRLTIHHGVLAGLARTGPFDGVLAINVNVFWTTGGQAEAEAIRRCISPGGRVVIAYAGAPVARHDAVVTSVVASLRGAGFARISLHDTPQALAVTARAPSEVAHE